MLAVLTYDRRGLLVNHPEKPGTVPITVCLKCNAATHINHSILVPAPLANRSRVKFKSDGTPDVPMVRVIQGMCARGHLVQGPATDFEEAAVAPFMILVNSWSIGYAKPMA